METTENDVRKAVLALFNSEPLPEGWRVISGVKLTDAIERQKRLDARRERELATRKRKKAVPDLQEAEPGASLNLVYGDEG